MKYLFIFMLFLSTAALAQDKQTAYDKVVEIMQKEFNYTYDSTSNVIPKRKVARNDSSKLAHQSISSLPQNMSPLVLVNNVPIKMEELKLKSADDIAEVKVLPADTKATALYGTRGSKGVLNLILKE